ncbi:MAG: hypothetical protein V1701_06310 [Planctomycetota bacterium]
MIGFDGIIKAILFTLGLLWCREIFERLKKDIEILKNSRDTTEKFVIFFYWIATAYIIYLMADFSIVTIKIILRSGSMLLMGW